MSDLKLEVYESEEKLKKVSLYCYELRTNDIQDSHKVIRSAVYRLKKKYNDAVFENGKQIFTIDKVDENNRFTDFKLKYEGYKELDILQNRRVYEELIRFYIIKKLCLVKIHNRYRKYSCKDAVTSSWIMTNDGFKIISSSNKEISLLRKYNFRVEVRDNEKAYLWVNTSSVFKSNRTIMDYIKKNINVIGMEVKNDWGSFKQSGIIEKIGPETVSDKMEFCDSLKAYYEGNNQGYYVEKQPDDSPVVWVKLHRNKTDGLCAYYPQALMPVLTREKVNTVDPEFSNILDKYVKRSMKKRIVLDKDFIFDIGTIEDLGGVSFKNEPVDLKTLDLTKGLVQSPTLVCGNEKSIRVNESFKVFNSGFYKKSGKIQIGYVYPRGFRHLIKAVANAIYSYAVLGRYNGSEDKYTVKHLLDIVAAPVAEEEYDEGSVLDYKRVARKLSKNGNIDIIIAIVPNDFTEDNPYNPFKRTWAQVNIPSQMITMSTAKKFEKSHVGDNTCKYFLQNIILGILGKTGGIPWIIKDMPGNADLFVGLDVATVEKGIHYPACSVVFDKYGRLIGFYKPQNPQSGEKISTKMLEDIFTEVLLEYENIYGEKPKNIIIHRDGFSNEDSAWYDAFFMAENINYSIIEIRKNNHSRLIYEDNKGEITNPHMGHCAYNSDRAYMVTTDIKDTFGAPQPLCYA